MSKLLFLIFVNTTLCFLKYTTTSAFSFISSTSGHHYKLPQQRTKTKCPNYHRNKGSIPANSIHKLQSNHHQTSSKFQSSTTLKMGLEINIRIVGRKNSIESTSFLQESYDMYTKRLSSTIDLSTTFHKSNDELLKSLQTDSNKGFGIVCLDEKGKMYTSLEFSDCLYSWLEEYGSRLVFVIGGAEGLPVELKQYQYNMGGGNNVSNDGVLNRKPIFMSLSKMTFTHPWARSILVEQIYRASEIHKGSGYHKE